MGHHTSRVRLKQWLERGEATLHPLSFPQRELWENSPVPVDDPANHICGLIEIKGALTEKLAVAVLQQVVDRQAALRTSFIPGREAPLQLVRAVAAASMSYRELSTVDSRPEALTELLREIYSQPFNLLQGPLYRAQVLRRSADDHLLALAVHHAIADGWSLNVFVRDLCDAYIREVTGLHERLTPVQQTSTDWSAAERAYWQPAELRANASYWKSQLAETQQIWPADTAAERTRQPLDRRISSVSEGVTASVRELTRGSGVTLFGALLAAFQLALSKWVGRNDLVVGTPVANRNTAAVSQTMGYFSGLVPLRGQVDRTRSVAEHFKAAHETAVDGFAKAMPFAEIAAALGEPRGPGRHTLCDVRFAFQKQPAADVAVPGISTRLRIHSSGTARFDFGCEITELGSELEVVWLSRCPAFTSASVAEMDALFLETLKKSCNNPAGRIAVLGL